ncbi:MAG: hypothetical protein ABI347_03680 [Nitrososphaera sp.]|jgi:hypothetical protein
MAEVKLAKENIAPEIKGESDDDNEEKERQQQKQVAVLEHEIECPRCRDSMTLCSDFDNLYYFCEECDFCLYTIKK